MNLKSIVENNDSISGRIFDIVIQFLIIISLISFTVETLPNLTPFYANILYIIEIICVFIFTIEYLLRIYVADKKIRFIFSFYGLIDLLAILPFYIALGLDLRSIRIFRALRLLRAFKILRYNNALRRFSKAFMFVKDELLLFTFATILLLYVSSVGIYYFEVDAQPEQFSSVFNCFWWSVATLTTVGYGDIFPITVGGRIFTALIVLVGIGVIAVPTGLITSALTKVIDEEKS